MDKVIVIYESKYGFTRCYAQWIAEALSCPAFERKNFHPQNLTNYDVIIYGGGLYAGGVSGIKLLTGNWDLLCNKKVILFTCGVANPDDPANISHIRESLSKVLTAEMLERIRLFHLRGGIDYSRLNFVHKSMMSMLRKMLLKKDSNSLRDEDRLMLDTYGKYVDFTSRDSIRPIIDYILSLQVNPSKTGL